MIELAFHYYKMYIWNMSDMFLSNIIVKSAIHFVPCKIDILSLNVGKKVLPTFWKVTKLHWKASTTCQIGMQNSVGHRLRRASLHVSAKLTELQHRLAVMRLVAPFSCTVETQPPWLSAVYLCGLGCHFLGWTLAHSWDPRLRKLRLLLLYRSVLEPGKVRRWN